MKKILTFITIAVVMLVVFPDSTAAWIDEGYVNASGLHLRSSPNSTRDGVTHTDNVIATLSHGDRVTILANVHGWLRVRHGGREGYVWNAFITIDTTYTPIPITTPVAPPTPVPLPIQIPEPIPTPEPMPPLVEAPLVPPTPEPTPEPDAQHPSQAAMSLPIIQRTFFPSGSAIFAIRDDGNLWAMGWNGYGRLGDGTITDRYKGTAEFIMDSVSIMDNVVTVSDVITFSDFGFSISSLAVQTDGSLWAWGDSKSI